MAATALPAFAQSPADAQDDQSAGLRSDTASAADDGSDSSQKEIMLELLKEVWRPALEIFLLTVGIYYVASFVRGTRGAAIFTGTLVLLLTLGLGVDIRFGEQWAVRASGGLGDLEGVGLSVAYLR